MKPSLKIYSVLCLFVILLWGNSLWIFAKANVAQYLIAKAWQNTLQTGMQSKPWPWADTWPVAAIKLTHDAPLTYVLAGSHGTSLAFGPGHTDGTALPHENGTTVIQGHRDTHFSYLQHMALNQNFTVQDKYGRWQSYKITDKIVLDTRSQGWQVDETLNDLHLITCYPFDSVLPSPPQRLILIASLVFPNHKSDWQVHSQDSPSALKLKL